LDAADFAIFDLEDAVAPADKAAARQALINNPVDPDAVIVRVNAIGTPDHALDLEALAQTEYGRIMVPKAEDPEAIAELERYEVIALCETARGVLRAPSIAEVSCVVALMWGAEDLVAGLGGRSSRHPDGAYLDVALHARSCVLLAAGAASKPAIDAVYLDIDDLSGLELETHQSAASGFAGKACIHPLHAPVVRDSFRPSASQLAWADRVLASAQDGGVLVIDGRMVDEPLLRQALSIRARAQR
jgi:citrate lyase subunit beta/citryl-CoA lyase